MNILLLATIFALAIGGYVIAGLPGVVIGLLTIPVAYALFFIWAWQAVQ